MKCINNKDIKDKLDKIKSYLKDMDSVLVAYSGGVDSTLILKIAYDVLGKSNVLAVTAKSPLYPESEINAAQKLANELNIRHMIISTDELSNPEFAKNPKHRCYLCKKELYSKLNQIAAQEGLRYILDGSNKDDTFDHRPGRQAAVEAGVRSLFEEVGMNKHEIRSISQLMGLPTYDKPSGACLASRFPYDTKITYDALKKVEKAEEYIKRCTKVVQVRVRHYGKLCRIEVYEDDIPICIKYRHKIVDMLKSIGYTYITLDLAGYRSGSMNEE
jgi:uncharacterized protein